MMNKSITQTITQEYFFRHAYFKVSPFWEVLIFKSVLIIENIRYSRYTRTQGERRSFFRDRKVIADLQLKNQCKLVAKFDDRDLAIARYFS